jgi:hypothetical protein
LQRVRTSAILRSPQTRSSSTSEATLAHAQQLLSSDRVEDIQALQDLEHLAPRERPAGKNALQLNAKFRSNQYSIGEGKVGIGLATSLTNHSCVPNVLSQYDPDVKRFRLVVARLVQPGEELVGAYWHVSRTYDERQQALARWGFGCNCSLCSVDRLDKNQRDKHDEARRTINRCSEEPSLASVCSCLALLPDLILRQRKTAFETALKEDLVVILPDLALKCHSKAVSAEAKAEWRAICLKWAEICFTESSSRYKGFLRSLA